MVLHSHISPSDLEAALVRKHRNLSSKLRTKINDHNSTYPDSNFNNSINKFQIPEKGIGGTTAYQLIHDELTLDGNPTLNLASFVNTYVPPESEKLLLENITKNLADNDEYPSLMEIHQRCISILAELWHAPKLTKEQLDSKLNETKDLQKSDIILKESSAIGTATVGSSEAVLLGGLALKKNWQAKRKAAGKDTSKPNILMGTNAQVALEKFARYFDVEARLLPVSKKSQYVLDTDLIKENVDENTIGVFVILGSTYTGTFEDVEKVSQVLDEVEKEKGLDIPIHVDGASGGFVAPFSFPHLKWDFQLPRVHSINASGHKFGLTNVGLGFVIWRQSKYLPEELKFELSYLGGSEESFTLNFSRPGNQVISQFYNFLSFGKDGYTEYFNALFDNARLLSEFLEESGYYECVSLIHRKKGDFDYHGAEAVATTLDQLVDEHKDKKLTNADFNAGLPVVAFKFTQKFRQKYPLIPQSIISSLLRNKGYIIPNYPLPPNEEQQEILRVVVRFNLSHELLDKLMNDIIEVTEICINATEIVKKTTANESAAATGDNDVIIREMLESIASSGIKNNEILSQYSKELHHDKKGHKHKGKKHGSYRGAC